MIETIEGRGRWMFPPKGYSWEAGPVDSYNVDEMRTVLLNLSDKPGFKKAVLDADEEELVDSFLEMGFVFNHSKNGDKETGDK